MPRMTPELLLSNQSYLNPLKDRELNLRGFQIPAIENLGVTKDSLDAIDLTDNSIRSLLNLPKLIRLKHLYLSNNPLSFISPNLPQSIPNLNSLVLSNCNLSNFNHIFSVLKNFKRLEFLVLTGNPVCKVKLYRDWCIFSCPKVRILDYNRVKDKERKTSQELFYDAISKTLTPLAQSLSTVDSTGQPDQDLMISSNYNPNIHQSVEPGQFGKKLTEEERERIKQSIADASSVDEVRRLKRMLDQGFIPKESKKSNVNENNESDKKSEENDEETVIEPTPMTEDVDHPPTKNDKNKKQKKSNNDEEVEMKDGSKEGEQAEEESPAIVAPKPAPKKRTEKSTKSKSSTTTTRSKKAKVAATGKSKE